MAEKGVDVVVPARRRGRPPVVVTEEVLNNRRLSKQRVNARSSESVDGQGPSRKRGRPPIVVIEEVLEQRRLARQRVNARHRKGARAAHSAPVEGGPGDGGDSSATNHWWPWNSCAICSAGMTSEGSQYYCGKCKKNRGTSNYSTMAVAVKDSSTCTMQLILQPREIAQLCGISPIEEMTESTKTKENEAAPNSEHIRALIGIHCMQLELCNFDAPSTQTNYVVAHMVQASKLNTKH